MNIAQQIKAFHRDEVGAVRLDQLVAECEQQAIEVEQDHDAESTTFVFVDGSVLEWCGPEISTYGSR